MTSKEYLAQLAQNAGLSQEEQAGLLKVAENEKFAKSLEEGVMLRSDYSRNMDALSKDKQSWTAWRDEVAATADNNKRVMDEFNARVAAGDYKETIHAVQSDFIPKKEFEAERQKMESGFINLLKVTTKLQGQHFKEFNEPLPVDELEALAVKNNIPLTQAYDELVKPRRAELSTKNLAEQLAAAKAEGAREFASTHKIPLDNAPREYHVMLDRDPKKMVGVDDYVPNSGQLSSVSTRQLKANFAEEWEKAAAGNS